MRYTVQIHVLTMTMTTAVRQIHVLYPRTKKTDVNAIRPERVSRV